MGAEEGVLLAFLSETVASGLRSLAEIEDPAVSRSIAHALTGPQHKAASLQEAVDHLWRDMSPSMSSAPYFAELSPGRRTARQLLLLSFLGCRHPALRWTEVSARLPHRAETERLAQRLLATLVLERSGSGPSHAASSLASSTPSSAAGVGASQPAEHLVAHYRAEAEKNLLAAQRAEGSARQLALAQHRAEVLESQLAAHRRELDSCLQRLHGQEQRWAESRSELERSRHEYALLGNEAACLRAAAQSFNRLFGEGGPKPAAVMYGGENQEGDLRELARTLAQELRDCYVWMREISRI